MNNLKSSKINLVANDFLRTAGSLLSIKKRISKKNLLKKIDMYEITCGLTREFANAVKLSQMPNPDFVCGGRKKAEAIC